jgi:hypothetical protein
MQKILEALLINCAMVQDRDNLDILWMEAQANVTLACFAAPWTDSSTESRTVRRSTEHAVTKRAKRLLPVDVHRKVAGMYVQVKHKEVEQGLVAQIKYNFSGRH